MILKTKTKLWRRIHNKWMLSEVFANVGFGRSGNEGRYRLKAIGWRTRPVYQQVSRQDLELASMEEAEHQFLIDPFDRSVALVFQMFQSTDLDPWDVDLSSFLEMFSSRIEKSENIDLPTCGRLIRMAWAILRNQASSLIERQERALDFEEDDTWDFEGGWETEFDDEDYNFSVGVLSGAADDVLPSIFEGRVHREEGRPVTLGELLMGLQEAGRLAEEQRTRERIAQERRGAFNSTREIQWEPPYRRFGRRFRKNMERTPF